MPLWELTLPGFHEAVSRKVARRDYDAGVAAACLMKAAGDQPVPVYALSGRLYLSRSGWLLLSVPNMLIRGVFDAMDGRGLELPPSGPNAGLNAHISVMTKEEVAKIGPDNISERGHSFRYQLGPIKTVRPAGWSEMSAVYFIEVKSPELAELRKSYGLTPLPRGDHQFHITAAIKRSRVLQAGPVSKAAESTHTDAEGQTYDVDRLINLLRGRPAESLPLAGLRVDRSRKTGFSPKRYEAYDPAVPGIVGPDESLVDGRHRAARLLDRGETRGPFVRASAADMLAALVGGRKSDTKE